MIAHWRSSWARRWVAMPGNLRGAVWLLAGAFTFAISVGAIKWVGTRIPVAEIAFFGVVGQFLWISPSLRARRLALLGHRGPLQAARAALMVGAMLMGFYAVVHLPLAEATALSFTKSLFVTVLAAMVLAEQVGWQRWSCTVAGFVGVIVMMRPDAAGLSLGAVVGVASSALAAGAQIATRALAREVSPLSIMIWHTVLSALLVAPIVAAVWVTPTWTELAFLAGMSLAGVAGQWTVIMASREAEASALAPIEYVRLPLVALMGFVAFAEVPTLWTWLGTAIIAASSFAAMRFELAAARRERDEHLRRL